MRIAEKHSREDLNGPTAKGTSFETFSTYSQREQKLRPTRYTSVCDPAEIQSESYSRSNTHTFYSQIPVQSQNFPVTPM